MVLLSEHHEPFEPELILIPAGEFLMGSDPEKDKNAEDGEQPQHRLQLPDYYIAKTPVTCGQYAAFVEATGHRGPSGMHEYFPVFMVTWKDAMTYCQWLAKTTGKPYRLPTEAEWEKAARGTDGRIYPWGDDPPNEIGCKFRYYDEELPVPVGLYSPRGDSPYGCVDMAGNVWEWTLSQWGTDYEKPDFKYPYKPEDGREDVEAGDDILRVVRGGALYYDEWKDRCACRHRVNPNFRGSLIGFRVCVTAQQE